MEARRTRAAALALALVGLLQACGGGGDGEPVAGSTTTTTTATTAAPPDEVAVRIDGAPVELARSCAGFDGAVVTASADGRRAMLVREGGTSAIRIGTIGGFAESSDVDEREVPGGQEHSAVIDEGGTVRSVTIFVPDDLELEPCPDGSSAG